MKKLLIVTVASLGLFLMSVPSGLAAGVCCIQKETNSDNVVSCQPANGDNCEAITSSISSSTTSSLPLTPIDCSLESKCQQYAQPEAPGADLCCVVPYNLRDCAYKSGDCPASRLTVRCDSEPTCKEFVGTAASVATTKKDSGLTTVLITPPKLSVDIPTLSMPDFLKIKTDGEYYYIPFISVYLAAIFKLGLGLAAVLAVIMIMIGGFVWLAAAGDSGKIKKAKGMITQAVIGLILALGSYTLLATVNPDLINLNGLKIKIVSQQLVETFDDFTPEVESTTTTGTGAASNLPPSQYDSIFAKYAPCAGVDPQVLKAIATAESGLNAGKVNKSGYIGLFQTKQANCPAIVTSYCTDLANPDNNTAAGAAMIKKSVDLIKNKCPNASAHDQMVMIYIAHNMGPGMLQYVTKNGCDVSTMRQSAIDYYNGKGASTAASYSSKYQSGCLNSGKSAAECTGGPKFDYAVKTADRSGVTQVLATSSTGVCPY